MKKLIILSIMVLGLVAFSIPSANATYCITLDGFCDKMEVDVDANGVVYGHWDINCDGTFLKLIIGNKFGSQFNVVGDMTVEVGYIFTYLFNIPKPNRLWTNYAYDGVNPPVPFLVNAPWTVTTGPCPSGLQDMPQLPRSFE
jgi:hypothetical protein